MSPGVAEDLTLVIELSSQIVSKISQSVLEFFLESIEDVMDIVHGFNSLLFVLLNFTNNIYRIQFTPPMDALTYV